MRISELSRQSGVSVPTIKFYLRERLLPPGIPTGRNQADYGERHLRRIRLVRTLTEIGGLDLASVRDILAAIDDDQVTLVDAYQILDRALYPHGAKSLGQEAVECAREEAEALVERVGWSPHASAQGQEVLAVVLAGLRTLGCEADASFFAPFAAAAEQVARAELDLICEDADGNPKGPAMVRGVLFGVALAALRRMAREHYVALRQPGHCAED